jgi:uncharacterized protein DUF6200
MAESSKPVTAGATPAVETILIDLGNKKPKQVKQLRKGKGKLMDSIQEKLQRLREDGTLPKGVPSVIVVVGKKAPKNPFFG